MAATVSMWCKTFIAFMALSTNQQDSDSDQSAGIMQHHLGAVKSWTGWQLFSSVAIDLLTVLHGHGVLSTCGQHDVALAAWTS